MVYVFLAQGFEEVEALAAIDLLRRGNIPVTLVAVPSSPSVEHVQSTSCAATANSPLAVTASHAVTFVADVALADLPLPTKEDTLFFPGGLPGAQHLADNERVRTRIASQINEGGIIAAICAAPALVLGANGFLDGQRFTCYPSAETVAPNAIYVEDENVVKTKVGNATVLTSKGVGTALEFALALISEIKDSQTAEQVRTSCLIS